MSGDDNNSTRKLGVNYIRKPDGSKWIEVLLLKYGPPHPRFVPSFRDLHRIIQGMSVCEDEKYPPPAKGRIRLIEFLRDAVREADFSALARKYKIPERDGDRIVNSNGATLSPTASHPLHDRGVTADEIKWGGQ